MVNTVIPILQLMCLTICLRIKSLVLLHFNKIHSRFCPVQQFIPFLPTLWWSVRLKHVVELILNKSVVEFDRIYCDSCYLKHSGNEPLKIVIFCLVYFQMLSTLPYRYSVSHTREDFDLLYCIPIYRSSSDNIASSLILLLNLFFSLVCPLWPALCRFGGFLMLMFTFSDTHIR
jgi:hypothetical protein